MLFFYHFLWLYYTIYFSIVKQFFILILYFYYHQFFRYFQRINNAISYNISGKFIIGLCCHKETLALKIKAVVPNCLLFLLPSSGRKSLFVSILRNQSYFQMTSILLICKINKKVAHTDLLGGTTFQIHMSI